MRVIRLTAAVAALTLCLSCGGQQRQDLGEFPASPTATAGSPSPAAGSPSPTAGSPSPTAGSPSPTAGSPSPVAGSPSPAATTTGGSSSSPRVVQMTVDASGIQPANPSVPAGPGMRLEIQNNGEKAYTVKAEGLNQEAKNIAPGSSGSIVLTKIGPGTYTLSVLEEDGKQVAQGKVTMQAPADRAPRK